MICEELYLKKSPFAGELVAGKNFLSGTSLCLFASMFLLIVGLLKVKVSSETKEGEVESLLRHASIRAFPSGLVIIGCNFFVANVYTWPVSLATNSISCVPVNCASSYACK